MSDDDSDRPSSGDAGATDHLEVTVSIFETAYSKPQAERHLLRSLADLDRLMREDRPRPADKTRQPLASRGEYPEVAERGTPGPPYLPVVDADEARISMDEAHKRGIEAGEPHVIHETHTAGRYRIFGCHLCRTREELDAETRRLAAVFGLGSEPRHPTRCPDGQWDDKSLAASQHFFLRTGDARAESFLGDDGGMFRRADPVSATSVDRPRPIPQPDPHREPLDPDELRSALAAIPNADRGTWIEIGAALHYEESTGCLEPEGGRKLFDEWSQGQEYPDYSDAVQERAWSSFHVPEAGSAVTSGTVFHLAREHGWRPRTAADDFDDEARIEDLLGSREYDRDRFGRVRINLFNAVIAVESLDLGLCYDELADRRLMLGAGVDALARRFPKQDRQVNDAVIDQILWQIRRQGIAEFSVDLIQRAVRTLAMSRRFNPVEDWLRSLKWDCTPRIDTWASRILGAPGGRYESEVGRIMLVSLVARALCPGIKYDTMVVLEGAQGRGKSSTLAVLGGEYYLEGLGAEDINGRDVVARLLGKWLVEIDEMEKARKADVNAFKSFLSHQKDTARLAYERTARDFHRRCCFVGTTNEDFYLKDDTGNRRFLPLRVTREIDLDEVRRERDQLFAEAVALWDADPRHESLVLPRDLWPAAAEEQELRRERHPWEEAIEQWLDHPDQTGLLGVQAGEILSEVIGRPLERQTKNDLKLVGAILRRLGWKFQSFRDPDRGGEVRKGFVPPDLRLAQLNWRRRLSKLPADARARAWEVMQ